MPREHCHSPPYRETGGSVICVRLLKVLKGVLKVRCDVAAVLFDSIKSFQRYRMFLGTYLGCSSLNALLNAKALYLFAPPLLDVLLSVAVVTSLTAL